MNELRTISFVYSKLDSKFANLPSCETDHALIDHLWSIQVDQAEMLDKMQWFICKETPSADWRPPTRRWLAEDDIYLYLRMQHKSSSWKHAIKPVTFVLKVWSVYSINFVFYFPNFVSDVFDFVMEGVKSVGSIISCAYFIILVQLYIGSSRAYDLCTCNQLMCDVPVNCTHGVVPDNCGCCEVCARGVHELCGGAPDGAGVCAAGLQCVIHARPGDLVTGRERGTCEGNSVNLFSFKVLFGTFKPRAN